MMDSKIPHLGSEAFECPYCKAFAHQIWIDHNGVVTDNLSQVYIIYSLEHITAPSLIKDTNGKLTTAVSGVHFSRCASCEMLSIWVGENLVYPDVNTATLPHFEMPVEVERIFSEARRVFEISPRSAAALLRLALQLLLKNLGESGKEINKDIGNLVKKGLDPRLQKAMDTVRVVGNHAVHPGQIDLDDNKDTARSLFDLINLIVDRLISQPNSIDRLFEGLPEGQKSQVERRDKNNG